MSIMHYAASGVFLCPHKFIISCFHQHIDFLANCWHHMDYFKRLRTYQSVLSVLENQMRETGLKKYEGIIIYQIFLS